MLLYIPRSAVVALGPEDQIGKENGCRSLPGHQQGQDQRTNEGDGVLLSSSTIVSSSLRTDPTSTRLSRPSQPQQPQGNRVGGPGDERWKCPDRLRGQAALHHSRSSLRDVRRCSRSLEKTSSVMVPS